METAGSSNEANNPDQIAANTNPDNYREYHPEDQADKLARELLEWLKDKFNKATFGEIASFVINVILVIVGVKVACIYWNQLQEMHSANQLTQSALTMNSRPWIGIADIKVIGQEITGSPERPSLKITYSIFVRNYGGSPARRVSIQPAYETGRGAQHTWQKWRNCDLAQNLSRSGTGIIVFQGTDGFGPVAYSATFDNSPTATGLIAPGLKWVAICIAYQGLSGDIYHTNAVYLFNTDTQEPIPVPKMPRFNYFPIANLHLSDAEAD